MKEKKKFTPLSKTNPSTENKKSDPQRGSYSGLVGRDSKQTKSVSYGKGGDYKGKSGRNSISDQATQKLIDRLTKDSNLMRPFDPDRQENPRLFAPTQISEGIMVEMNFGFAVYSSKGEDIFDLENHKVELSKEQIDSVLTDPEIIKTLDIHEIQKRVMTPIFKIILDELGNEICMEQLFTSYYPSAINLMKPSDEEFYNYCFNAPFDNETFDDELEEDLEDDEELVPPGFSFTAIQYPDCSNEFSEPNIYLDYSEAKGSNFAPLICGNLGLQTIAANNINNVLNGLQTSINSQIILNYKALMQIMPFSTYYFFTDGLIWHFGEFDIKFGEAIGFEAYSRKLETKDVADIVSIFKFIVDRHLELLSSEDDEDSSDDDYGFSSKRKFSTEEEALLRQEVVNAHLMATGEEPTEEIIAQMMVMVRQHVIENNLTPGHFNMRIKGTYSSIDEVPEHLRDKIK